MWLLFQAPLRSQEWKMGNKRDAGGLNNPRQRIKDHVGCFTCCRRGLLSLLDDNQSINFRFRSQNAANWLHCKHFYVVTGTISSFFQKNETDSPCFIPPAFPCCSTLRLFRSILQWIISAALLTTLAWNWHWGCLLFVWEQRTRERWRGRKRERGGEEIESPTGTVLILNQE